MLLIGIAMPLVNLAQPVSKTISGKIVDANQIPIPGATIKIIGTNTGVTSNTDGHFSLKVPEAINIKLSVRFVGFAPRIINIVASSAKTVLDDIVLHEKAQTLEDLVITATRKATNIQDVPVPIQLISKAAIRKTGVVRLNEILQEQTGLLISSDHGTGLQIQGLSSDYALILIDGEPVIGRTAGTLDLSRITVNGIEQIEIVKGPTSSLYGSEAMAGVVNIITRKNTNQFSYDFNGRYRTNNTLDLNSNVGLQGKKIGFDLALNLLTSDGYDLTPNSLGQTNPSYHAYTVSPKLSYKLTDKTHLRISGRYYREAQDNLLEIQDEEESFVVEDNGLRRDYFINGNIDHTFNENHKLRLRNYYAKYKTNTDLIYQQSGEYFDQSFFDQTFNRTELQHDAIINEFHDITLGAGYLIEKVNATRYRDLNQFNAYYLFGQHQWIPNQKINLVAGARFDYHSEYASRLSPKLSGQYKFNKKLKIQASVGAGYKAPDFRQLLLNFTNPVVGYSVFGASVVQEGIRVLEAQGQVAQILIDPSNIQEIKAESSWAYNLGWSFKPLNDIDFSIKGNFFRNEIKDLIETAPVVRKTNGQNVFSYFNFDEVITQGLEIDVEHRPLKQLTIQLGYQFLYTRDKEKYDELKAGNIFGRDETGTFRLSTSNYKGLFNRSNHSGNIKLFYHNDNYDFDIAVRGIYKGAFGVADLNANGIYDEFDLTAKANILWNLTVQKHFQNNMMLEVGTQNLLDTKNEFVPTNPGRILFVGFAYSLTK